MNNSIMILIMVFVLLLTFTNADYLNTKNNNRCIYNVQPNQGSKGLCYTQRHNGVNKCIDSLRYSHLIDGYEYVNSGCYLKNDLELTGLSQEDWNYFLAFLAHLLGLTMLMSITFLSINTSRFRS